MKYVLTRELTYDRVGVKHHRRSDEMLEIDKIQKKLKEDTPWADKARRFLSEAREPLPRPIKDHTCREVPCAGAKKPS